MNTEVERALLKDWKFDKRILNTVVVEHLYREGLDVAEQVSKDLGISIDPAFKEIYRTLHEIVASIQSKNLEPALKWCAAHRSELQQKNSPLEFRLHKLRFVQALQSRDRSTGVKDAIGYARANFSPFASFHMEGISLSLSLSPSPFFEPQ